MSEQKPTVPEFLARLRAAEQFEPYLQAALGADELQRRINQRGKVAWRPTEGKAPPRPEPLPIGTATDYGRVERVVEVDGVRVYYLLRDNVAFTLPAYMVEPPVPRETGK